MVASVELGPLPETSKDWASSAKTLAGLALAEDLGQDDWDCLARVARAAGEGTFSRPPEVKVTSDKDAEFAAVEAHDSPMSDRKSVV